MIACTANKGLPLYLSTQGRCNNNSDQTSYSDTLTHPNDSADRNVNNFAADWTNISFTISTVLPCVYGISSIVLPILTI